MYIELNFSNRVFIGRKLEKKIYYFADWNPNGYVSEVGEFNCMGNCDQFSVVVEQFGFTVSKTVQ